MSYIWKYALQIQRGAAFGAGPSLTGGPFLCGNEKPTAALFIGDSDEPVLIPRDALQLLEAISEKELIGAGNHNAGDVSTIQIATVIGDNTSLAHRL
jgi:hypothetical protein